MKIIISTFLVLLSLNTNAADLLRMLDGHSAICKTKYDTIRSKANNIYMLKDPTLEVSQLTINIKAKIFFLSCDKIGETFKFSILKEHMTAQYTYPDFERGGVITATRIDKKKEVLAFDEAYAVAGKSKIFRKDGQHFISITLDKTQLDINNFPQAQEKGNYFTTLTLRSQTKVVTDTIDLGYSLVSSGSYRLFFDLENNKISF